MCFIQNPRIGFWISTAATNLEIVLKSWWLDGRYITLPKGVAKIVPFHPKWIQHQLINQSVYIVSVTGGNFLYTSQR